MTRTEHMQWSKDRAMAYVEQGSYSEAVASMLSDLGKHEETKQSHRICAQLGMLELICGPTRDSITKFVNGFN